MNPRFTQTYANRREAGRLLAAELAGRDLGDPVVVALPRGGVPVAHEVARGIGAPLDITLVRKVGAPLNPELAVGAIADDGQLILDGAAISDLGISRAELAETIDAERAELERRRDQYRGESEPLDVTGRPVLLVDDGVATGSTAIAAARALRSRGASRVTLAVPVGPQGVDSALAGEFDEVICPLQPRHFGGVGRWYDDFSPTTDAEVIALLEEAERGRETGRLFGDSTEVAVRIPAGRRVALNGDLRIPPAPEALVIFAHGSGSGRNSPRNRSVAEALNEAGFATLLLDLLTEREERVRGNVFNIELLAERLLAAIDWAETEPSVAELPVGLFGASTGAAAALLAAAVGGEKIGAVVSRGGRPDLAEGALTHVLAPTLLIVGGADRVVLGLNENAAEQIAGPVELAVVPGAGHLFEETGALALVARYAIEWFEARLAPKPDGARLQPR